MPDGRVIFKNGDIGHDSMDIISRYQETINEEKLDELAIEYIHKTNYFGSQDSPLIPHYAELCYKAGYLKAMENKI